MKNLLVIILFVMPFITKAQDTLKRHTVTLSSQIEYAQDSAIYKSASVLKEFLLTKNTDLVQKTPFVTKEHIVQFLHMLFMDSKEHTGYIPLEFLQFQIFDYKKEKEKILFKTLVCYEFPDDKTSFTIVAIFNSLAVKTKNGYEVKLVADDYMKKFVKMETKWATYYAEKSSYLDKKLLKKADAYCDSLAAAFGTLKPKKTNYVIMNPHINAMQYFGLEYYWTDTNFIDEEIGLIIDNKTASPFYKHELSHYVLQQFTDRKMFKEGLATYTSGKANDVSTFANEVRLLKKEADYKNVDVMKDILYVRKGLWLVYPIGALLSKKAYEMGGIEKLKALHNTDEKQDILELITEFFELKNQRAEEFVIQLIDEYK